MLYKAYINNILFGYGVMFPDIEFTSAGVEEEQWQVFDSRDGSSVRQFIKRLSDGAKTKWEAHYGPVNDSKLPDSADVKYIASLLRGDFDCAVSMNAQLRNASEALIALTKEQYRCLDQLDDNPRCPTWGSYLSNTSEVFEDALWLRLPQTPVCNHWQAPMTFEQLKETCSSQGISLTDILQAFAPSL